MSDGVLAVESPLRGEVFVVFLEGTTIRWSGPAGPAAWRIEVAGGSDPMDVVREVVSRVLGPPTVLHSTSWRTDSGGIVLTFLAIVEPDQLGDRPSAPVSRVQLARGDAVEAPTDITEAQVIEHALRHLAWLVDDDPAICGRLSPAWRDALDAYPAEPFQSPRWQDARTAARPPNGDRLELSCECGYAAVGERAQVIADSRAHAHDVHNLSLSDEEIEARLRPQQ